MSSSDRTPPGRRRILAGFAGAALLAGCGFEPMYGRRPQGAVGKDLAQIRIAPLPERPGQILHNALRDRLNPAGQPADPTYELHITLTQVFTEQGILRDETASRTSLTMMAEYELVDLKSNTQLTKGLSRAATSFNILDDRFATTVSEQNARERVLQELADDMTLRLSAYFSARDA